MHAANIATAFVGLPTQSGLYDFPYARVQRGPGMPVDVPKALSHFSSVASLMDRVQPFGWVLVHASVPESERAQLVKLAAASSRIGDWAIYGLPKSSK